MAHRKSLDEFFKDAEEKLSKKLDKEPGKLPYYMARPDGEVTRNFTDLILLSQVYSSKLGKELRSSKSHNDVATFLSKLG